MPSLIGALGWPEKFGCPKALFCIIEKLHFWAMGEKVTDKSKLLWYNIRKAHGILVLT